MAAVGHVTTARPVFGRFCDKTASGGGGRETRPNPFSCVLRPSVALQEAAHGHLPVHLGLSGTREARSRNSGEDLSCSNLQS